MNNAETLEYHARPHYICTNYYLLGLVFPFIELLNFQF